MSELAAILWPLTALSAAAISGKCVSTWLRLRAVEAQRRAERDERESGVVAKLAADFKSIDSAWKAFQANNRR